MSGPDFGWVGDDEVPVLGRGSLNDYEHEVIAAFQNNDPMPPELGTREYRKWQKDAEYHKAVVRDILMGNDTPPHIDAPGGADFWYKRSRLNNAFDAATTGQRIPEQWLSPDFAERRQERLDDLRAVEAIAKGERLNHGSPRMPAGVVAIAAQGIPPATRRPLVKAAPVNHVGRVAVGSAMPVRDHEAVKGQRHKGARLETGTTR